MFLEFSLDIYVDMNFPRPSKKSVVRIQQKIQNPIIFFLMNKKQTLNSGNFFLIIKFLLSSYYAITEKLSQFKYV